MLMYLVSHPYHQLKSK